VFFSSHVLADAEALCSRVAILAGGRLVAVDELGGLDAFHVRGYELVVNAIDEPLLERLRVQKHVTSATALGVGRYALQVPLDVAPALVLTELAANGAQLVSMQPVRDTLEDLFVRQVSAAPGRGAQS
jgi:ABC-2 type transport system ATP-binding protein